jgi:hypothetical protein
MDIFVFGAPVYLLIVIALLGFVGCAGIIDIDEWEPEGTPDQPAPLPAPTNFHATPGDGVVILQWDPIETAIVYEIDRGEAPPGNPPPDYDFVISVTPAELAIVDGFLTYEDHDVTNGVTYHYVIKATLAENITEFSDDIEATPKAPFGPFITGFTAGTTRPGEDGWFGFGILVGAQAITVQKLGRFYGPADTGTHEINIIEASSLVVLGTATVSPASESLDGFMYDNVQPSPVDLKANNEYYVLSHEALGGDEFLTQDTTVITRPEGTVTNAIDSASLLVFTPAGGPDHTYGPVNFQY